MQFGTPTCERCGIPSGDGAFCDNCGVLNALPEAGLYAGSLLTRFWARLLDSLLFVLTGGLGWWIWLATSAGHGQSPAKRILGLRVVATDGAPLDAGTMWFRDGVLALLLTPLLPLNALWALRSPRRQTIHDLLSGSVVVSAQARPLPGYERDRDRDRARHRERSVRPEALPSPVEGPAEGRSARSRPGHPEALPSGAEGPVEARPERSRGGRPPAPEAPPPPPRRTRSTGPARSQTPATSGSTTGRRASPPRHPVSSTPPRSGSTTPSNEQRSPDQPAPGQLNWPSQQQKQRPPARPADDRLSDDRPMWPSGVPPWQRSPGAAPPPPPARSHHPRHSTPHRRTTPSTPPRSRRPGRVTDRGVEFPDDVTGPMARIAELERRYRAGQLSQSDFEDARRRIIAES